MKRKKQKVYWAIFTKQGFLYTATGELFVYEKKYDARYMLENAEDDFTIRKVIIKEVK